MVRINNWRRLKRTELRLRWQAAGLEYKRHAQAAVSNRIVEQLDDIKDAVIGFYWPMNGEIDLRKLIVSRLLYGAKAALSVRESW